MTFRFYFLLVILISLAGCGPQTLTIEGTVKFNGKEVEDGFISFNPIDGQGSTAGAAIKKGHYKIVGLTPGKRLVEVSAPPLYEAPKNLPDDPSQLKNLPSQRPAISPDALNNRQTIEIIESRQYDLDLQQK